MNTRSTGRTSSASVGADQIEIGGVGIEHAAALVGDHDAVEGVVDDRLEHRIVGVACRQSRMMPAASANSANTPTMPSSASSARI